MTRPFDETVVDRLQKDREFAARFVANHKRIMLEHDRAVMLLQMYRDTYPAFRLRPVGAEGSIARADHDYKIEIESRANEILRGNNEKT